ncbi:hypothetical protein DI272_30415 [Streptomyces sp. Act143]|uniref:hypothetical protein n=1 Tax=Streptomyces sp. Act143 TaxID=2200760 RepID=UPI000D675E9B|nr:hypothetical protein [Streptomyces sp. Act143]PWI17993.1 hypothetical protein DI272_30415 [Streptomyces sp. Act143]
MDWTGAGDGWSWGDPDNWSESKVPGPDDEAVIRADAVRASAVDVRSLTLIGASVLSSTALIRQRLTVDCDRNGGLLADVELGPDAQGTWLAGTIQRLHVPAGATVSVTGTGCKSVSRLVVDGVLELAGEGLTLFSDGLFNSGEVRVTAPSILAGAAPVENQGIIRLVGEAPLTLDYPGGVAGPSLRLHAGSLLDLGSGTMTLRYGDSEFERGAVVTGNGTMVLTGRARLTINGRVDFAAESTFELARGGILYGETDLAACRVHWTGGQIINRLTVPSSGSLRIDGWDDKVAHGLLIQGEATLGGGAPIRLCGRGLTNQGTVLVAADSTVTADVPFENQALLRFACPGLTLTVKGDSGLTCQRGSALDLNGSAVWLQCGDSRTEAGAGISGAGALRLGGENVTARLTADGPLDVTAESEIHLARNSYLYGRADFGAGKVVWTGGEIMQELTVPKAGTLWVADTGTKSVRRLTVVGTATFNGPGRVSLFDDGLINEGVLLVSRSMVLDGSAPLHNHGTLRLGEMARLTLSGVDLHSDGAVELGTGRVTGTNASVTLSGRTAVTIDPGVTNWCGRVVCSSALRVAGQLDVEVKAGRTPDTVLAFPVACGDRLDGAFDVVSGGWWVAHSSNSALLRADAAPRFPAHPRPSPRWRNDGKLEARLRLNLNAVSEHLHDGPVAVVNLAGPDSPAFAAIHGSRQTYVASIAKLAPLLAACQLRADLRRIAAANPPQSSAELFETARQQWNCTAEHGPQLDDIFWVDFAVSPVAVDFVDAHQDDEALNELDSKLADPTTRQEGLERLRLLGFADRLRLMAAWSNNDAATAVIRVLGLPYVAAVVQDCGLYDVGDGGGLWLGAGYGDIGGGFGPDPGVADDPRLPGAHHNASAESLARFFILLLADRLIDADPEQARQACGEIRAILDKISPAHGVDSSFREALVHSGRVVRRLLSKIGIWHDVSECAAISTEDQDGSARRDYIAVGLAETDESALAAVITALEASLAG